MKDLIIIELELFARLTYAADDLLSMIANEDNDREIRWRTTSALEKAVAEAIAEIDKCPSCDGTGRGRRGVGWNRHGGYYALYYGPDMCPACGGTSKRKRLE